MNVKINSTGGLSVGDATNGYKDLATKEYVDNKTFTVSWNDVSGKPTTFTPSSHNHSAGDINSGTLDIARIPTGTSNTTVSLGNHTHSDYVSKSETSSQSLSGSLSFPAAQQAYFGNQNSSYAWVWDAGFGVGVGSTDHTGIQHDKITHTVSSDTVTLTFPSSVKSGVIATEYDIRKRTRVLYESVIGNSSTPASAITISEDYNIYHFWIGANGTFPTFTFSFPNFESIPARFPFTLIAHVNSGATTLTGPSGWAWTSGAGLPTSGFAGKVLWISGLKKTNDSTEVPLVSCWRCA